jgi:hypothetical protein
MEQLQTMISKYPRQFEQTLIGGKSCEKSFPFRLELFPTTWMKMLNKGKRHP